VVHTGADQGLGRPGCAARPRPADPGRGDLRLSGPKGCRQDDHAPAAGGHAAPDVRTRAGVRARPLGGLGCRAPADGLPGGWTSTCTSGSRDVSTGAVSASGATSSPGRAQEPSGWLGLGLDRPWRERSRGKDAEAGAGARGDRALGFVPPGRAGL